MIIQKLKCDLLDVFENDDCTLLEKLISACQEFRACVTAKIEKRLLDEEGNFFFINFYVIAISINQRLSMKN